MSNSANIEIVNTTTLERKIDELNKFKLIVDEECRYVQPKQLYLNTVKFRPELGLTKFTEGFDLVDLREKLLKNKLYKN